MKNICFITGSRAEYGLLEPLMRLFSESSSYKSQIIITGTHLSPEFGLTKKEIDLSLFSDVEEVEILLSSDSSVGVTKSMGLAMISFGEVFNRFNPDLLIILGDRYEMLSVAAVGAVHNIPIAHLHGGEITEGAFDDSFRHAITKLSNLHFTSTEDYRRRVIQLGEQPEFVYNVGAIGVDRILNMPLLSKKDLEDSLSIKLYEKNILITYHPETRLISDIDYEVNELLDAFDSLDDDIMLIFTKANSDPKGQRINLLFEKYVNKHRNRAVLFDSLGSLKYISLIKFVDAVVGNSSSGIIEVPYFDVPVVNIGDRQKGRIVSNAVIHTRNDKESIIDALRTAFSSDHKRICKTSAKYYGDGKTSEAIFKHISSFKDFSVLIKKIFYDK